jgi:hypothetical protein
MEPDKTLPPNNGQEWGDTNLMQEDGDCEGLLEAVNCLAELSFKTSYQGGLYIVRVLVQACWEVPIRVMNVSDQDEVLDEGTTLGCCKRHMCGACRWFRTSNSRDLMP